jgi:site-specific DNA-cytosine methylase
MPLGMAVDIRGAGATWPTPVAEDAEQTGPRRPGDQTLTSAARASWPTPTATDGTRDGRSERNGIPRSVLESPTPVSGHNLGLSHAARLWPTPQASDSDRGPVRADRPGHGGPSLTTETAPEREGAQLRTWATPTARDWKDTGDAAGDPSRVPTNGLLGREVEPSSAAGALAPEWVEWLMGFPLGWTDPTVDDADLEPWAWDTDPAEVGRTSRLTTDRTLRKERLKALGNAVVPACAELIGRELMERWKEGTE